MIETQSLENYQEFGNNSTKVQPDAAKYSAGFVQSDVLPAEWVNWAWSKNTKGITALNKGVTSIENELGNLVREVGDTPVEDDNTQVVTAVEKMVTNIVGAKKIDGKPIVGGAITHFCTSTIEDNIITVTPIDGTLTVADGSRIEVLFPPEGYTYESTKKDSETGMGDGNKVTVSTAAKIKVGSGSAAVVRVGGECAGEGFANGGDTHTFTYYNGSWYDTTADVIYKGGDSSTGYYEKKRNGSFSYPKSTIDDKLNICSKIIESGKGNVSGNSTSTVNITKVCKAGLFVIIGDNTVWSGIALVSGGLNKKVLSIASSIFEIGGSYNNITIKNESQYAMSYSWYLIGLV